MSIPILILSDCPSQTSGLARITRDLCTLIASMTEFRVATLGFTGTGSSRLPFQTYHMLPGEFGDASLPMVWDDWSRGEPGILFTIWDLSRMMWLARPEYCEDEGTRQWLEHARKHKLRLWSYLPIDSSGPRGRLTVHAREVMLGIDRIATYSPFARDVVTNTIGSEQAEHRGLAWLPHGLNLRTFSPGPREVSKVKRIGIIGTNQLRKGWGDAAAICAGIAEQLKGEVSFWWHIDVRQRHWNIDALLADFQLGELVELSSPPVTDKWLAEQYRRCDLTLLPSYGEGFGYSWAESFACNTPCLHTDYAGGASLMRTSGLEDFLVPPANWRLEGLHNQLRSVSNPQDWVERALALLAKNPDVDLYKSVDHLGWMKLGHVFKRWLIEGLGK